ncbi:MAG: hypothetical protein EOO71_19370 [Myxococcaceae bacterium]|nr:MAG: hypothetical protein EOO71_19370 [Myxococcaceae bacterium]
MDTMLLHLNLGAPEENEPLVRKLLERFPATFQEHMPLTWIVTDTDACLHELLGWLAPALSRDRDGGVAFSVSLSEVYTEKGPWTTDGGATSDTVPQSDLRSLVLESTVDGLAPRHARMLHLLGFLCSARTVLPTLTTLMVEIHPRYLARFCERFMETKDRFVVATEVLYSESWP